MSYLHDINVAKWRRIWGCGVAVAFKDVGVVSSSAIANRFDNFQMPPSKRLRARGAAEQTRAPRNGAPFEDWKPVICFKI
jgi:hypothetical protein